MSNDNYNKRLGPIPKVSEKLTKALAEIKGGVTVERCGCKSRVVEGKDGKPGKSVLPCKGHALQQISAHQQEIARMFAHIAEMELEE